MSFTVVREIKHLGQPPRAVRVLHDYQPDNILTALDIAKAMAHQHASDAGLEKPVPTRESGYMFWSNSGSVVIYRAEEVTA